MIRLAIPDDLPQILRIEEQAFETDLIDEHTFKKYLKKNGTSCHLYVSDTEPPHGVDPLILGYILVFTSKGKHAAVIHSFAVGPNAFGKGIGADLLEKGSEVAKHAGHTALMTYIRVDNWPAIRRYKKSGFHIIGVQANYYEDGCDAVKYLRNL
jgi:ribosomal protein S18 acetylase RimI-like enzyme